MQRVSSYPMHRPSQLTDYICFKLLLGFQSPYRRPFRASTNLAERLGVEPSDRLHGLQISNLLHYHPAPAP